MTLTLIEATDTTIRVTYSISSAADDNYITAWVDAGQSSFVRGEYAACVRVEPSTTGETSGVVTLTGLTPNTPYFVAGFVNNGVSSCDGLVGGLSIRTTQPFVTAITLHATHDDVELEGHGTPPTTAGGTDGKIEVEWHVIPGATYELEYRLEDADSWTAGTLTAGEVRWELEDAGAAGSVYVVRARVSEAEDWTEVEVAIPDVQVLGAGVWYDAVREGDMLLVGEYLIDAEGTDQELVRTIYAGVQGLGAARLYPYWQSTDYGDGCDGFLSTARTCPEADGQGRGLFSAYYAVAPETLAPIVLSSSRGWAYTSPLVPAVFLEARLVPELHDALVRVGDSWEADLVLSGELTELGVTYLLGVLPRAASYALAGLLPIVEVSPEATRTPLPTPTRQLVPAGEIDVRVTAVAEDTGMTPEVVFSLATVLAIVGLVIAGTRHARVATAGALAFAVLIPYGVSIGWLGVEAVQALAILGAYGIVRRMRRDLPSG